MAEEVVDKWLVLQAETCEEEGGLWMAATPFASLDEAKAYVEDIVRTEWCAGCGKDRDALLADCRGKWFPESSSIKWSLAYYSEDGSEAWTVEGYDGYAKKIKVVKMGEKGDRIC